MFPLPPLAAVYFQACRPPIRAARFQALVKIARLACHLLAVPWCCLAGPVALVPTHSRVFGALLEKAGIKGAQKFVHDCEKTCLEITICGVCARCFGCRVLGFLTFLALLLPYCFSDFCEHCCQSLMLPSCLMVLAARCMNWCVTHTNLQLDPTCGFIPPFWTARLHHPCPSSCAPIRPVQSCLFCPLSSPPACQSWLWSCSSSRRPFQHPKHFPYPKQ